VGSAELWLGASELGAPLHALVRAATVAARQATGGGSLAGALEGIPEWKPGDDFEPSPAALLAAVRGGRRAVECFLDVRIERECIVLARAGGRDDSLRDVVTRSRVLVSVEGELAQGGTSEPIGLSGELDTKASWRELLRHARARAQKALALSRAPLVPLGEPRRVLLSPGVVTWILHGPLVEGFALARAGARSRVAPWLEVDDEGGRDIDEQGLIARPVPLIRSGAWLRGPFLPFDGSGRTRRDPRTGMPRAAPLSLALRATAGSEPRRSLLARADLVLGAVASADPLPGGGVHLWARGSRRVRRAWRPVGLVTLRLELGELLGRATAASREREPVFAQGLDVLSPWILAEGVLVRPG
jgi:hypothetical protein